MATRSSAQRVGARSPWLTPTADSALRAPTLLAFWSGLMVLVGLAGLWSAAPGPVLPDASPVMSWVAALDRDVLSAGAIAVGAAGLVLGRLAGRPVDGGRRLLLVFGWAVAAVLVVGVPGPTVLASVGYTPVLLLGAPFGWPADVTVTDAWNVVAGMELFALVSGMLWAAALVRIRRTAGGLHPPVPDRRWTSPERAARWGRWAVGVAVVIPLVYAVTRWAWALGIPLGISEEAWQAGADVGLWGLGAGLGAAAALGALLTLGLVLPWGERVPRAIPLLGGRRIPPAVATVPATVVAALLTAAGLRFVGLAVTGAFTDFFAGATWTTLGPELLWPFWGLALGSAALAYHLRRHVAVVASHDRPVQAAWGSGSEMVRVPRLEDACREPDRDQCDHAERDGPHEGVPGTAVGVPPPAAHNDRRGISLLAVRAPRRTPA